MESNNNNNADGVFNGTTLSSGLVDSCARHIFIGARRRIQDSTAASVEIACRDNNAMRSSSIYPAQTVYHNVICRVGKLYRKVEYNDNNNNNIVG